jgi:hypothetical protein
MSPAAPGKLVIRSYTPVGHYTKLIPKPNTTNNFSNAPVSKKERHNKWTTPAAGIQPGNMPGAQKKYIAPVLNFIRDIKPGFAW